MEDNQEKSLGLYSPLSLPTIERTAYSRTFESPLQPGNGLTITFLKTDNFDHALMVERWTDANNLYLTGQHPLCKEGKPLEVPGVDNQRLSFNIIQQAATLECQQAEGPNRISLETLLVIAQRDPFMWEALQEFSMEVTEGKAKQE